ncbi:MAG: DUF1353 domain-containing protein [Nanoarchaeota archaeon]|nr:DUF1353 domain-containing protein [Nanoarchaeota archaeon]
MSSFTEDLVLKWLPELKKFRVYLSFDYHIGSEDSDEVINIPEGYLTDLASIPPIARWLIPKLGRHAQAATLHDYIYEYNKYSRKKCDKIFLEAMKVLKVPFWKRQVMHKAVRMFGWISWNNRRYSEHTKMAKKKTKRVEDNSHQKNTWRH